MQNSCFHRKQLTERETGGVALSYLFAGFERNKDMISVHLSNDTAHVWPSRLILPSSIP